MAAALSDQCAFFSTLIGNTEYAVLFTSTNAATTWFAKI